MDVRLLPMPRERTVWLWAIYLFSNDKRGSSACYISQVLRLPYKTAWFVLQRLRYAMAERENKYMLSGTVELDDTYVGAPTRGKKRGRGTEKMKVITALSKDENGERKFKLVPNIATDSLGQETVTVGLEEVAQAMTPGYEVKFLVDPAKILSSGEPIADFQIVYHFSIL